jgi:hypothetical protein
MPPIQAFCFTMARKPLTIIIIIIILTIPADIIPAGKQQNN